MQGSEIAQGMQTVPVYIELPQHRQVLEAVEVREIVFAYVEYLFFNEV